MKQLSPAIRNNLLRQDRNASVRPCCRPSGPIVVRARLSRVVFLAIAMALSAAAGSTIGAMAASAFYKPQPVSLDDARSIEVNNLRGVITQLSAEIASLKASVDNNAKAANAQIRQDRRACRPRAGRTRGARAEALRIAGEARSPHRRRPHRRKLPHSPPQRRKSPARSRPSSRIVRRWWPAGSFAKCSTAAP